MLSDGETQWGKVALPAAPEQLDVITHIRDGQVESVEPSDLAVDFLAR